MEDRSFSEGPLEGDGSKTEGGMIDTFIDLLDRTRNQEGCEERTFRDGGIVFEPAQNFIPIDLSFPGLSKASTSPPVYVVDNFLTPEQCNDLISQSLGAFVPAPVVGVGAGEISTSRTSTTCYLERSDLPTVVGKVSRLLLGKPIEHIELPQCGRYMQGEEYKAHFDAFDLASADGRRFAENGGQRVCTVLIYLNDVPSGGQTAFPILKLAFQPKQGRALVFFPATLDGVLDSKALHAAMPAVDPKFVCQVWVRQRVYNGVSSISLNAPI